MAKPKWGTKRLCQSCGIRFYDLKKNPISCPNCETIFTPETKVRKPLPTKDVTIPTKSEEKESANSSEEIIGDAIGIEDVDDIGDDDVADDSLIEDTSDLGQDDEVSEVKEHIEESPSG